MKVLLPFWNLGLIDRYQPQFDALASEISELVILYTEGTPPDYMNENVSFFRYELPRLGHKYLNWWYGKNESELGPQLDIFGVDVVYSLSGLWMNIYGQSIADMMRIPHVIRIRGDMNQARKYQKRGLVQRLIFYRAFESCFRRATLVTSIVEKFIPWLRDIGVSEDHIGEVVPNGVSVEGWAPEYPDTFTPGYVGRVSKEKGSEFLLELIKATPQFTWIVTGPIQDLDFVPPNNCHYLGRTPFENIGEIYNKIWVLVQPSHTEGFPNVLLESYINKKLVLGSVDAIPEEVTVFGRRMSLDSYWMWADVLVSLSKLPKESFEAWGAEAREYALGYTWKAHGEGIARQLQKAINLYKANSL